MFGTIFGFSGRINRLTWWMIQLFLLVCGIIINFVLEDSFKELTAITKVAKPTLEQMKPVLASFANYMIFLVFWGIISNWLFISSTVQRLHDRGSAGWRALFAYAPLGLVFLSIYYLIQLEFFASFALIVAAGIGMLISSVWLIVECGCLPSEDCENDYGDPMGSGSRRDTLARELAEMRGETFQPIAAAKQQLATAVAAPPPRFASPNGPPVFGRR